MGNGFLFGLIPFDADPAAISAPFTHDKTLVGLSMLVGVLLVFASLQVNGRARAHRGLASMVWMGISGAVMGAAVWGTHFVGLIAFTTPLQHGFMAGPTIASALLGVGGGAVLFLIAGVRPTPIRFAFSGVSVGIGAVLMHYVGMHGIQIEAVLTYRPLWVMATTIGALVCCFFGFWIGFKLESGLTRALAAVPLGAAIAGLHYTDIAATIITPRPTFEPPAAGASEGLLAWAVCGALFLCAALALAAVEIDRRRQAAQPAEDSDAHVVVIPTPSAPGSPDTIRLVAGIDTRRRSQG